MICKRSGLPANKCACWEHAPAYCMCDGHAHNAHPGYVKVTVEATDVKVGDVLDDRHAETSTVLAAREDGDRWVIETAGMEVSFPQGVGVITTTKRIVTLTDLAKIEALA